MQVPRLVRHLRLLSKTPRLSLEWSAGVFEFDNFTAGSRAIADAIVEATDNGAFSLVGGGDSVAV